MFLFEPPGTSTKSSAKRINSALALRSSGVAMARNSMAFSSPSSLYAQRRMEMMDFVAAMPLFAMSTLRITRLPPCAATYLAIASVAVVSALDSAGAETAAFADTSRPSGSAATRGRGPRRARATAGAAAWCPTEARSPRTAYRFQNGNTRRDRFRFRIGAAGFGQVSEEGAYVGRGGVETLEFRLRSRC